MCHADAASYQVTTGPWHYVIDVYNDAPTTSITHSPTPAWNATVTLNANGSDPDGGALDYTWSITSKPSGSSRTLSSTSIENPSITFASDRDIGDWSFRVYVDDNEGERKSFTHSFNVPNVPPSITITGPTDVDATDPIALGVTPTVDTDGGNLTFSWDILSSPPGASVGPASGYSTASSIPPIPTTGDDVGTWQFQVTAKDDENTTDTATVNVEVHNLPPEIDFVGDQLGDIGDLVNVETTFTEDLDGGALTYQWNIVQAPGSSAIGIQSGYSTGPSLEMPTTFDEAGTWIFELTVTDDEGESVVDTWTTLVDGPPQAVVDGPGTIDFGSFPLVLDGRTSWDPDTDCELDPARDCHITDGRAVSGISGGITGHTWYVEDVPYGSGYWPGRADDALGVNGRSSSLTLDVLDIRPGQWTFELEVADAESNNAYGDEDVYVQDPNAPPVAVASPSARWETDALGGVLGDVSVSVTAIDLDNLLLGDLPEEGTGIIDYSWTLTPPTGCVPPVISTSGLSLKALNLYAAGTIVGAECLGTWDISVQVTDDDMPALSSTASTQVIIGNCPSLLCIDQPTTAFPAWVELASDTEVLVVYHLDATVYDDSFFAYGLFTTLAIYSEADALTPVFTSFDPNVLTSDRGSWRVFHWNGQTNAGTRVLPGVYHVQIGLDSATFVASSVSANELESIWIETANVRIDESATRYVDWVALDDGTATAEFPYSIDGAVTIADAVAHIKDSFGVAVADIDLGAAAAGTARWDGEASGTMALPGTYTVEIEALSSTGSFGSSAPRSFVVYKLDLKPVGPGLGGSPPEEKVFVNGDDDNGNGVEDHADPGPVAGENDLVGIDVTVEPAVADLRARLRFDAGAGHVALYRTADKATAVAAPANYDLRTDVVPMNVYAEGVSVGDEALVLELSAPDGVAITTRTVRLHVGQVDLDVDSNMDATVNGTDDSTEMADKALIVDINNDDGDADGADHLDNSTDGAADIAQMPSLTLRRVGWIPLGGTVELNTTDRAVIRIFDENHNTGVIGPPLADGGPNADTYVIPSAGIAAGDLDYRLEAVTHGNVTLKLRLYDASHTLLAEDSVKVVGNVDRTPSAGATRFRVNGNRNFATTTLLGIRGRIESPEAHVNWAPTIRRFSSSNVWFSVQEMLTTAGDFWLQTGLAVDRDVGGTPHPAVYFEVNTGTADYYINMRPGGWLVGADYSVAVEDVATGKVVARVDGVEWDHYTNAAWATRRVRNYQVGSELFHSVDQNAGKATDHCRITNMEVNDAGTWTATGFAAADVEFSDYDKNGVEIHPATSTEWAYSLLGPANLEMWDLTVEY